MVAEILKRLHRPKLFGPKMLADPYPYYARLRRIDPVHWAEGPGHWVLTRYADIVSVLRSPHASAERIEINQRQVPAEFQEVFTARKDAMLSADPPRHTRLRLLVNKAFTPGAVADLAPFIQRFVDDVIDTVQPRGRLDVIRDLAYPLPATVIAEMLGVPHADRDRFKQWSDDIAAVIGNFPGGLSEGVLRRGVHGMRELRAYFRGIVVQRRVEPRDDLISALVKAQQEGDRLNEAELLANAVLLLNAGHETTTNLIGNGILALLRHPDQLGRLREDPARIPTAVEELLRYDSPVQFTSRVLKTDLTLGGKQLRAGQTVLLVLGAANRDPAQFPDPDRLDVGRADNKHLSFGLGSHYCLGAPLARLEGRIVFETLLRRLPGLRLAGSAPVYRQNFNLRGLEALEVTF
jgi:pimeloyl-[acyl-carrier protein] synthase